MPNEMIERVAKAIYPEIYGGVGPNIIMEQIAERIARVAIEAIREPTEEMKLNGGKAYRDCGGLGPCPSHSIFNAMIDTALKE